jgi:hypothetical protein
MQQSLGNLVERPFLGRYWDEWWTYHEPGNYIHNLLSYAANYGIPVFAGLVVLIALCAVNLLKMWRQGGSMVTNYVLPLFVYCVLAGCLVRSYTWENLWLALGLAAGQIRLAPSATDQQRQRVMPRRFTQLRRRLISRR